MCSPVNSGEAHCYGDEPSPFSAGMARPTTMGYWLGYRYYDNAGIKPLFPFGYGLSYTTFSYGTSLTMSQSSAKNGDTVNVMVPVKNTGSMDGDEVSFLFVSYPNTQRTGHKSVKELKGFQRTTIAKGTTGMVTFPLRISDLKYWDTPSNSWKYETGSINVMVGSSADPTTLTATGTLTLNN